MSKKTAMLLVCLLLLFLFTGCGPGADSDLADTVIIGTIYTVDNQENIVTALAIKDGEYVYVGDEEGVQEFIGNETEVITLEEGIVIPSFTDGHAHGADGGVRYLFEVNLYEATSIEEYIDILEDFIKNHPELTFIRGGGWYNGYFPDGLPTAEILDAIDTDLPIVLSPMDGHSHWVNSKAMELMGVDASTPDVPGGVVERDAEGNPVGCFRENAMEYVTPIIPEYTVEEYKAGILAWQDEAISYGITAYWDPIVNDPPNLLQAYKELEEEGQLIIRVYGGYAINYGENTLDEVDKCKSLI